MAEFPINLLVILPGRGDGKPSLHTGCYRSGALTSNSCFTLQGIQVSCTITSVAAIETVPAVAVEVSW